MKQTYWAIVYQDDQDAGYGAMFPDFPGCVTVGDDMTDLMKMADEALTLHIDGMHEDGDAIPAPTAFEALPDNAEPDATEVGRIPVTVAVPGKKRRMNLTLDGNLVDQIESKYGKRAVSGFLENAARRAL
ncbi:type II toxin-antitoxin system HicB family antitoxin [Thalassospira alkalitolerans]|uniref:type II toxin-antitoxin system HicB family antitoxin n=1 Tax=Thalassospira alkalitolerans TaxID=1293890 RepID=UPI0030EEE58E|tara:strand:+ start:2402 stop:2791 length:390 start_codon:yes stop_codon:yes gene_type:complete